MIFKKIGIAIYGQQYVNLHPALGKHKIQFIYSKLPQSQNIFMIPFTASTLQVSWMKIRNKNVNMCSKITGRLIRMNFLVL